MPTRYTQYYTALKQPDGTKLTPQACTIVAILWANGAPMTRKELTAAITASGVISKQKPTRILAFYKKILLASGFITVEKRQRLPDPK